MNLNINDLLEIIGEQAKQVALLTAQVKAYERKEQENENKENEEDK